MSAWFFASAGTRVGSVHRAWPRWGSGLRTLSPLVLSLLLGACSPALDWREVKLGDTGMAAQFPCRPASQQRRVDLAGVPTTMTLNVCEASGITFAVSHADVSDPARVGPALRFLRDTGHANLGAAPSSGATSPWRVPGMTPQSEAGQWQIVGRLPDGRVLTSVMGLSSRGTVVVQASASAASLQDAARQSFFEGIRFQP